jgi:phage terminase Nu1 subunit (DNA packaging protein)
VTVTKGEFAILMGVTPQAVTAWMRSGKLAEATVGEGRAARIDVAKARSLLDMRLDQARSGTLDDDKSSLRKIRAEKAKQAELLTAKMKRAEETETTKFVSVEDLKRALWDTRTAFLAMIEATHRGVAEQIKAKLPEVDARLVRHALGQAFLEEWRRYHEAKPEMFGSSRRRSIEVHQFHQYFTNGRNRCGKMPCFVEFF